jgi:predicted nucleic acid-binding Zn finger protein
MAEVTKRVLEGEYIRVKGDSGREYKVYALGKPEQWCSCPSYKNQGAPVSERDCKHTLRLKAAGIQ